MEFDITVESGSSVRLPTSGKYCDRDIVVTATGGVVHIEEKDVNFYNYDGTLLHSYTLEEAQTLTELPPAPQMHRDFLTFEEWNWSLEDIKALNLPLSVMATVCPTDGSTKAVLEITDSRIATVQMFIKQVSGALTVCWGDGSEPTTFAAASNINITLEHTYAAAGEYIVTICTEGSCLLGHGSTTNTFIQGMNQLLKEVYIDKNTNINNYGLLKYNSLNIVTFALGVTKITSSAFWQSTCVKSVSLPNTITSIDSQAFADTCYLDVISLPASVEVIIYGAFTNCRSLRSITIPFKCVATSSGYTYVKHIYIAEGVKDITGEFAYNGIIRTIEIPSTIENIAGQSFRSCNALEKMVFKSLVPPIVANSNAFTIAPFCIVEVPAESLEAYQNATNYASIAAQMVGV